MADTPPKRPKRASSTSTPAAGEGKRKPRASASKKAPGKKTPGKKTTPAGKPVEVTTEAEEVELDDAEPEAFEDVEESGDESSEESGEETSTALVPIRSMQQMATGESVDLLQRYMAEVHRYPLLSREDELALAREYRATGDPKIAYRLVTANLRLVVKIAWEYRRAAFDLLDLIQEGNVGLVQGVKKFDPDRGVKLSSYAAWWIRAYIIRHLMDNWRLVKLGTTQAQRKLFFNLRKEKERLAAQGFAPEPKLLAERLEVSEQDVIDMDRRLSSDDLSLDTPLSSGDKTLTIGDRLEASAERADDQLANEEIAGAFREKLAAFAKTLKDKELYIFQKRLVSDEPLTLQEIGTHYGISRERARQLEARLVQRLKAYMKEELPGFAELSLEPPDE